MKAMQAVALCLLVTPFALAQATPEEARERWLKGNYAESRELYDELAKVEKHKLAAALGISKSWQSEGDHAKALAVIETALKADANQPDLLARKADLLYLQGRWDEADKVAEAALKAKPNHLLARWVRAQIYRDKGDFKKADAEFRWFVRYYNDNEVTSPDELLLIGLAACENARWNALSDQFEFVLEDVWGEAVKLDKNYWPALVESGLLLLEKYNRADALPAFEKALVINPQSAEAYVGKGQAALQKLELKDAELFAERALKINANLLEALILRADVHLATGKTTPALEELARARKLNPRSEEVLGRIAACRFLQKQDAEFKGLVEEVGKHNTRPGNFYYVLAERLEAARRFNDAETFFKKSIELRPMVPWARNSLGMLYMRMGREPEATDILNAAFKADEFNVRVSNTLKVLEHLKKYETIKTEHFVLRYDAATDKHLASYMAKYLELMYEELAKKFTYRPKGPFLIEVFNNHEMFSGRTVALPDLHTIGACTGRVVAMVSPRGMKKPFNWARVLRHELVHIFNLDQTRFLLPHWFTEGLAVTSEGYPRPQSWNEMLLARVPAGDVLNLDTIDLAFMRPRSPEEWQLAYCQAQLYVEYIEKTHGAAAIGGLLAAYADGLDTAAALEKVCKVTKGDFEKGYREHLKKVVASLRGRPAEKAMTFRELQDAHDKNPNDLDMAARLAEMSLKRDKGQARKLADAVLTKKKDHALAAYVKAVLLRAGGDDEQAQQFLETAATAEPPEPKALQTLGKLYFDAAKFDKAAELFERARKAQPHDARWLNELVRVYAQSGDKDKLIAVLKDLAPTDADDLDARRRLARLLLERNQPAQAEKYAREALEIDVLDAESEELYGDALAQQKKHAEAIEPYEVAAAQWQTLRRPERSDEARLKLAKSYQATGAKEKALAEVNKVLERDPARAEALALKKELEK